MDNEQKRYLSMTQNRPTIAAFACETLSDLCKVATNAFKQTNKPSPLYNLLEKCFVGLKSNIIDNCDMDITFMKLFALVQHDSNLVRQNASGLIHFLTQFSSEKIDILLQGANCKKKHLLPGELQQSFICSQKLTDDLVATAINLGYTKRHRAKLDPGNRVFQGLNVSTVGGASTICKPSTIKDTYTSCNNPACTSESRAEKWLCSEAGKLWEAKEGESIVIKGIKSKPELNGTLALSIGQKVTRANGEERSVVILQVSGKKITLRHECMRPLDAKDVKFKKCGKCGKVKYCSTVW